MSSLQEDIISTADSFTKNFADRGSFDYSMESLIKVDELLEEMSDYMLDEDSIYNICTMVGSYVFETAHKNFGGEYFWIADEEQPILIAGDGKFEVSMKAWEKVRGRLENGEEDNILFYISGYRDHIYIGMEKEGYKALIV